jgi:hypothetical protein
MKGLQMEHHLRVHYHERAYMDEGAKSSTHHGSITERYMPSPGCLAAGSSLARQGLLILKLILRDCAIKMR